MEREGREVVRRSLWGEGTRGREERVPEGGSDFADEVIADRMTTEFADVAQLVEQLIRNQQVNGSSPFVGSISSQGLLRLTAVGGALRSNLISLTCCEDCWLLAARRDDLLQCRMKYVE